MAFLTGGLARRLFDPRLSVPLRVPDLAVELVDELASIEVRGAELGWAQLGSRRASIQFGRDARLQFEAHSGAIWSIQAGVETGEGTASPFNPPTRLLLDASLPLRVPESLADRLGELGLRLGDNLAIIGAPLLGDQRCAVLGMRTIGTLDEDDAARISWWLPSGGAVELRLVEESGRCWLHIVDLVQERDASEAHAGPNVLLTVGRGCQLAMGAESDVLSAPSGVAAALRLDRSPVMQAWVRYAALRRKISVDRQAAREQHPLSFTSATQRESNWEAQLTLEEAPRRAWLGASDEALGRNIRVEQSVALRGADDQREGWTVKSMSLSGVSSVRAVVAPPKEGGRLPPSGTFVAVKDRGAARSDERERQALDRLSAGRAACARLPSILADPSSAEPARAVRLRPSAADLDADQKRAVELIVGCVDLVAIQGPPGTGKTRVIVEALQQILLHERDPARPVRVLISSVQNEAVANVVERTVGLDGLLVRQDRREGADEDEALRFASLRQGERRALLERLRKRLDGFDLRSPFQELADLSLQVDAVRGHALAARSSDAAAGLGRLAVDATERLGAMLRSEASELAAELRASMTLSAAEAAVDPAESSGPVAPPADLGAVGAWWQTNAGRVPVAHRAACAFAVDEVERALSLAPGIKRDGRLKRAQATLFDAWAEVPAPTPAVDPPEVADGAALEAVLLRRVDAWCRRARGVLRDHEKELMKDPRAIAQRFERDLEAEAGSWEAICDRHAEVVAATCSRAATVELPYGEDYDWVIIDEAGRASPIELMVPMVQGKRVVLIGDHRQLPPMVDQAIIEAADKDAAVDLSGPTLFGELYSRLKPSNCVRLGVQYRMHGDIGALVDQAFYRPHNEGLASKFCGPQAVERRGRWGVFENAPLVWIDVASRPSRATERNDAEVEAVAEVVRRFVTAGAGEGSVAVICPYQKQRSAVAARLYREPELGRVAQVRTIDQVQGREYETVILTLVRSDGSPGFMASPNRMNVALSRAQRQLIVIGNARSFLDSERVRVRAPHLQFVIERMLSLEQEL